MPRLDRTLADRWAGLALANVARPYPYKLDQLLHADLDARPPGDIHPAFWGSYDWHSCVHMHWTLARLLRRCPDHRCAAETARHLSERLTPANIEGEVQALARPGHASFERPYGWGWLLKLAAELRALATERADAAGPARALAPLAQAIADRWLEYLPRIDYPTRAGSHANTAFALLLTLDYAEAVQHRALIALIGQHVERWFGRDRRYPADYEPGGEDFLSPGLVEAALVRRAVDGCSFDDWWRQFEPTPDALATWLTPARISDPTRPEDRPSARPEPVTRMVLAPAAARASGRPYHAGGAHHRGASGQRRCRRPSTARTSPHTGSPRSLCWRSTAHDPFPAHTDAG